MNLRFPSTPEEEAAFNDALAHLQRCGWIEKSDMRKRQEGDVKQTLYGFVWTHTGLVRRHWIQTIAAELDAARCEGLPAADMDRTEDAVQRWVWTLCRFP